MNSIISIAYYEAKTLYRSWFFRIFAILIILIITLFNLSKFVATNDVEWELIAVPANLPYTNFQILNFIQSVVAIFLAADFLRRDKKLDTTETIYMKPMSNEAYVCGKLLGNLWIFMVLNFIVMGIGIIFNIGLQDMTLDISAYFIYFGLISIPSLIFIFGLSFMLMSLIKNQALTFLTLLAYIGITVFYLQDKMFYLFDYMGYKMPMTKSQIVGFSHFDDLILQRGAFFLLGIGAVMYTIVLLQRLVQNSYSNIVFATLGTLFFCGGIGSGTIYYLGKSDEVNQREAQLIRNDKFSESPIVIVESYNLDLKHNGTSIDVTGDIEVINGNSEAITEFPFTLNKGLEVTSISRGAVTRDENILFVTLDEAIQPGDTTSFKLSWSGEIIEYLTFPEIETEDYYESLSLSMANVGKRYAFIEPNQVVLTKEVAWYPLSGVRVGNRYWGAGKQFSNFSLKVETTEGLEAISQGARDSIAPGVFNFPHQGYLPQISLTIGDYEIRRVDVEGINVELAFTKGNNYFDSYFDQIGDTIPQLINEVLGDFERSVDLYYQFPYLKVVEVPVHFKSYDRSMESGRAEVQPGMILVPEKGVGVSGLNLMSMKKYSKYDRRGGRDKKEEESPKEQQTGWFLRAIKETFTTELARPSFRRGAGSFTEENVPLYIYPMFFNHISYIESDAYPVLNRVLDIYTKESAGETDMMSMFMRNREGTNQDERANVLLEDHSLSDLLRDIEDPVLLDNVIKLKGSYLFSTLEADAEDGAFASFLRETLNDYHFMVLPIDTLNRYIDERFGFSVADQIDSWFNQKGLPGYLIQNVSSERVREDEDEFTMVSMDVANTGDVDGLLKVTFVMGGGRGGRGGRGGGGGGSSESIVKLIQLKPNEARHVSYILEASPRMTQVNTLCSKNIPSSLMYRFDKVELNESIAPEEENRVIEMSIFDIEDGTIIVDNEDSAFTVMGQEVVPPLKRLIATEDENASPYKGMDFRNPPQAWTLTTNSDFNGDYIKSAYYCKGGDGDRAVKWTANIEKKAYYEIYASVTPMISRVKRYSGGKAGSMNYTVKHADGEEDATINLDGSISEWMNIGLYYLPEGECSVILTNECEGRMVFADAIKFIRVDE